MSTYARSIQPVSLTTVHSTYASSESDRSIDGLHFRWMIPVELTMILFAASRRTGSWHASRVIGDVNYLPAAEYKIAVIIISFETSLLTVASAIRRLRLRRHMMRYKLCIIIIIRCKVKPNTFTPLWCRSAVHHIYIHIYIYSFIYLISNYKAYFVHTRQSLAKTSSRVILIR